MELIPRAGENFHFDVFGLFWDSFCFCFFQIIFTTLDHSRYISNKILEWYSLVIQGLHSHLQLEKISLAFWIISYIAKEKKRKRPAYACVHIGRIFNSVGTRFEIPSSTLEREVIKLRTGKRAVTWAMGKPKKFVQLMEWFRRLFIQPRGRKNPIEKSSSTLVVSGGLWSPVLVGGRFF